jgi:hypothetical protein
VCTREEKRPRYDIDGMHKIFKECSISHKRKHSPISLLVNEARVSFDCAEVKNNRFRKVNDESFELPSSLMLLGIAVLGKSHEPLYLRNLRPAQRPASENDSSSSGGHNNDSDPLGLSSMTRQNVHASLPLDDQIILHAALDSFEEKVDRTASGQMPSVKKQNVGGGGTSNWPHWVGLLLIRNRSAVYGYVTATNIKFFVLVEGPTNVKEMQDFMKGIHMSYIEYIMNPFFLTKGGIQSTTFDDKVRTAMEKLHGKSEPTV